MSSTSNSSFRSLTELRARLAEEENSPRMFSTIDTSGGSWTEVDLSDDLLEPSGEFLGIMDKASWAFHSALDSLTADSFRNGLSQMKKTATRLGENGQAFVVTAMKSTDEAIRRRKAAETVFSMVPVIVTSTRDGLKQTIATVDEAIRSGNTIKLITNAASTTATAIRNRLDPAIETSQSAVSSCANPETATAMSTMAAYRLRCQRNRVTKSAKTIACYAKAYGRPVGKVLPDTTSIRHGVNSVVTTADSLTRPGKPSRLVFQVMDKILEVAFPIEEPDQAEEDHTVKPEDSPYPPSDAGADS